LSDILERIMRTQDEIRHELGLAAARRAELWRELGRDPRAATRADLAGLTRRIEELWTELRSVDARERFGPPELIVRRAERDARVERDIERCLAREGKAA
jgi:hypothetical protein